MAETAGAGASPRDIVLAFYEAALNEKDAEKAAQFLARTRRKLVAEFTYHDTPTYSECQAIATCVKDLFLEGEVDEVEVELDPNELRIDVYRSSGPGGQSVNTTDSAVRITHIPSGLVVTCQNEKSQLKNKETAMLILRSRLYELEQERRRAELDALKGEKQQISFGSQIRNYVLYPYQLVKDVRTGIETGDVNGVLDGDIDRFVVGYHRWRVSGEQAAAVGGGEE